jgi:hypothetical protein
VGGLGAQVRVVLAAADAAWLLVAQHQRLAHCRCERARRSSARACQQCCCCSSCIGGSALLWLASLVRRAAAACLVLAASSCRSYGSRPAAATAEGVLLLQGCQGALGCAQRG